MAKNKIRRKQLNETEVSGFISEVYSHTLSGKSTDLNPVLANTHDLGQDGAEWRKLYLSSGVVFESGDALSVNSAGKLTYSGKLVQEGITGSFYPTASGIYDVGAASLPWKNIYTSGLVFPDGEKVTVSDGSFVLDGKIIQKGPQGSQGGFGGDSVAYSYYHQTGVSPVQDYPETGYFTFNATPYFTGVDYVYVNDSGVYSADLIDNTNWLRSVGSSDSVLKGTLRIFKKSEPFKFVTYDVDDVIVDQTTYYKIPVEFKLSSEESTDHIITGAFESGDGVVLSFAQKGDMGQVGPQGPGVGDIGPQGPQGDGGPQGILGPQGPSQGPQGAIGTGINWSGHWSPILPYSINDGVYYGPNYSSYVSLKNSNLGYTPTGSAADLWWDFLTSGVVGPIGPIGPEGGPPGDEGPQGDDGIIGPQGAIGPQGVISGHTDAVSRTIIQAGNSFSVIDVTRYNGSQYTLSRANSKINSETVGVITAIDTGNDSFTFITEGFVEWGSVDIASSRYASFSDTGGSFTPGAIYFLDDSNAGVITETEPVTIGSVSKPIFYAISASGGFVKNYRGQVIESGLGSDYIVQGIGDVTMVGDQTLTSKRLSLQTSYDVGTVVLPPDGKISIDFDQEPMQTINVNKNIILLDTINRGAGKTVTVRLKNSDATVDRILTFNSEITFIGSLAPTVLSANTTALLSLTSFGPTEADTVAAYASKK